MTMHKRSKARIVRVVLLVCVPLLLVGAFAVDSALAANPSPTTVPIGSGPPPIGPGPSAPVIPHPIGVPTGPVSSLADCPSAPAMSSPLPAGASLSKPFLAPAGLHTTANGKSTDYAGSCVYTVKIPSSDLPASADASPATPSPAYVSVTWISGGTRYAPVNAVSGPYGFFNLEYNICYINVGLLNWGGYGYAGMELVRGYCNTDSSGIWSNVMPWSSPYVHGGWHSVNTFGTVEWQGLPGSIFSAEEDVCLQDPLGQHNTYTCWDTYYGPFF